MLGTVDGLAFQARARLASGSVRERAEQVSPAPAAAGEVSMELPSSGDFLSAAVGAWGECSFCFLPDLELSFDLDVEDLSDEEQSKANSLVEEELELSFSLDADEDLSEEEQEWIWDVTIEL